MNYTPLENRTNIQAYTNGKLNLLLKTENSFTRGSVWRDRVWSQ